MKLNILLLDRKDTPWISFLGEYFEDTASQLHFFFESSKAAVFLDSNPPDMVFVNAAFLSRPIIQKLKMLCQSRAHFKLFHLGPPPKESDGLTYEESFIEPQTIMSFQKQLTQHLVFPELIRVLVIDDESEIGGMMRDYFSDRVKPAFEIQYADDGCKGLEILKEETFNVIVLDIKMPVMDGRDVYREIKSRGIKTPVIIYFDAIFGDEMVDIHKHGHPAVVEKGSGLSTMPEMMTLIKKLVYFG